MKSKKKSSNRDVNLRQQLRLDSLKSQWLTHKVINPKWSVVIIEELCFKVVRMNANISKMKKKAVKCRKEMDFICHFLAVTPSAQLKRSFRVTADYSKHTSHKLKMTSRHKLIIQLQPEDQILDTTVVT